MMVPLYKPYMPENLPELELILHSGALAYGRWGKIFEQKLAEYIGVDQIVTTGSASSAMLVAILAMGLRPGDKVIASPMSCLASNQPFLTQGLHVIWADIDPETGTLDPDSVRKKMSPACKAIFHNHYCGYTGHIDEINQIGREFGIMVADDATEAFGSEYKGKKTGNTGADLSVFSFQTIRLPNTIDGGAIAFNNHELYQKALLARDYGIDRNHFRDSRGEIDPNCDISMPGFGATLNEVNSYIGAVQMDEVDRLIGQQRANKERWKELLQHRSNQFRWVSEKVNQHSNGWVFGLLTDKRDEWMLRFREEGFYASKVHLPNHRYAAFGFQGHLKGVEEFYSKFLALPNGWWFSHKGNCKHV